MRIELDWSKRLPTFKMWLFLSVLSHSFVLFLVIFTVVFLLEKLKINKIQGRNVLISGCDHGFGFLLAQKCLQNGMTVFAGCLTEKGETQLKKISVSTPGKLHCFFLDVTKEKSIKDAKDFITDQLNKKGKTEGLWGLVNNAGVLGPTMPDDFLNIESYQNVLDVNLFGVIRMCQAFKPLVKLAEGRIVNMASVSGRIPGPCLAPYTVSKHGVEAYSDALRYELLHYGVTVHILEPQAFKTPMTDTEKMKRAMEQIYSSSSKQLQKEYGLKFLDELKSLIELMWNGERECLRDVSWVVDTYYHALTALYPRRRYWIEKQNEQCGLLDTTRSPCQSFSEGIFLASCSFSCLSMYLKFSQTFVTSQCTVVYLHKTPKDLSLNFCCLFGSTPKSNSPLEPYANPNYRTMKGTNNKSNESLRYNGSVDTCVCVLGYLAIFVMAPLTVLPTFLQDFVSIKLLPYPKMAACDKAV